MGLLARQIGRFLEPAAAAPSVEPAARIGSTLAPSGLPTPAAPAVIPTKAPCAVPVPEPTQAPRSTPTPTPKRSLYAVRDRAGIIVGVSPRPVPEQPSAAWHADHFLDWLGWHDEFAGHTILADVLARIYVGAFCRERHLEPLPWRSVATQLRQLTDDRRKRYKWILEGGCRKRRRAYALPDLREELVYAVKLREVSALQPA